MDTHFETLAAWADGEPVNRADVLHALERADGRDYVVDIMALRHLVAVTTPMGTTAETRSEKSQPVGTRRWPMLVTAAAAAIVCVAAGYGVGRLAQPEMLPGAPEMIPVDMPAPSSAPAPTHVIRFEAGVDWRETTGGN